MAQLNAITKTRITLPIPHIGEITTLSLAFPDHIFSKSQNHFYFRHGQVEDGTDTLTKDSKTEAFLLGSSFAKNHLQYLTHRGKLHISHAENNQRTKETAREFLCGLTSIYPPLQLTQCISDPYLNDFNIGNYTESEIKEVMQKYINRSSKRKIPLSVLIREGLENTSGQIRLEEKIILSIVLGDIFNKLDPNADTLNTFVNHVLFGILKKQSTQKDILSVSFTSRGNLSIVNGVKNGQFSTDSWVQSSLSYDPLSVTRL